MINRIAIFAGTAALASAGLALMLWEGQGDGTTAQTLSRGSLMTIELAQTDETVAGDEQPVPALALPRPQVDEYRFSVQQQNGTVCETEFGICTVPPQPIGSPCRCSEDEDAPIGQIAR